MSGKTPRLAATYQCQSCGREFHAFQHNARKYCSVKCSTSARRSVRLSILSPRVAATIQAEMREALAVLEAHLAEVERHVEEATT